MSPRLLTRVAYLPTDATISRPAPASWPHLGLALTAIGVIGALFAPRADGFNPAIPGILFAALGWLILRRRARHNIGRLYLALGAWLAWFAFLNGRDPGQVAAWLEQPVLWLISWAWVVGLVVPITLGILLLPDGQLPSRRWRWVVRALAVGCGALILALPYDSGAAAGLRLVAPPKLMVDIALAAGALLVLVVLLASLASPFVRYRRASASDRSALRLVGLLALASAAIYFGGTSLPSLSGDVVAAVALAVLPVGVTIAIVRHGMGDIDRLVSRAVAYLLVTGLLVGVYAAIALIPFAVVGSGNAPDLVVAVATLAAAALFRPARSRIQKLVDRRFNRSRYDAARTVERFAASLRSEVRLESLAVDLRALAGATVAPAHISLWLAEGVDA